MTGYAIDWILTLTLLAVIVGGIGTAAAIIAAWYAHEGVRLQRRQDEISPAAIEVSGGELYLLRKLEEYGPMLRGLYRSSSGNSTAWRLEKLGCVRNASDAPENRWVFEVHERLLRRDLTRHDRASDQIRLTDSGRAVLQKERAQKLSDADHPISFAP